MPVSAEVAARILAGPRNNAQSYHPRAVLLDVPEGGGADDFSGVAAELMFLHPVNCGWLWRIVVRNTPGMAWVFLLPPS